MPYKFVDGEFVSIEGQEETLSSRDQRFDSVVIIKRCPNLLEISKDKLRAKRRRIIGQGVEEVVDLAYLV